MTKKLFVFIFILLSSNSYSQTLNLNNTHIEKNLRRAQLNGDIDSAISFTLRPLYLNNYNINKNIFDHNEYAPEIFSFLKGKGKIKILPVNFNISYSSNHPYNRNNGSMITNKGYQQLISAGIYFELGPLSVQINPENIYATNDNYNGFWEGHYDIIWARKYMVWNRIDTPERFGESAYKNTNSGQSSVRLNFKSLSIGFSSENIWWGPSTRNGIMMSNNAQGFNHLTFNTRKPIQTKIGNFEFQLVTGILKASGFTPPNIDRTYAGTKLYVPKKENNNDRFFQGFNITYSPAWINGLHIGINRWVQIYEDAFKGNGDYEWIKNKYNGNTPSWLLVFNNLLRKNDRYEEYELETDQAASLFFRWFWKDSKTEIFGEWGYNDSLFNLRDLLLDTDHSRAFTLGFNKLFDSKNSTSQFEFSWEWTKMEQTPSRLLRDASSWYMHSRVRHGFTNNGEVMGASIGPGSNSQYFGISKLNEKQRIGLGLDIIERDNDFFYRAWEDSRDFRRYWKDYNFHLFFEKKFRNFWGSINVMYSKSLNYQWELLEDPSLPYYQPGRDLDNFHIDFKLTLPIKF